MKHVNPSNVRNRKISRKYYFLINVEENAKSREKITY